MHISYQTKGVCSAKIELDVENGVVKNVTFRGGCDGNLKGLSRLVEGMSVEEVARRLEGLTCGNKSTSCPDQLAKALQQVLVSQRGK